MLRPVLIASLLLFGVDLRPAAAKPVDPTPMTHLLQFRSITDSGHCSGTAIGPFALLTASHCEFPTDTLTLDGEAVSIVDRIRDHHDHTIFLLALPHPFREFANVSQIDPKRGDRAILVGNPGPVRSMFRVGVFAGTQPYPENDFEKDVYVEMFDLIAAPGDSGGGVFDDGGTVYAVISQVMNFGDATTPMWVPVAYPLRFTDRNLDRARGFRGS